MDEESARALYLYPSGLARFCCGSDNDGYPTCMGDGSMCGFSAVLDEPVCERITQDCTH